MVQVKMPEKEKKKDPLDTLMSGIQIAGSIANLKGSAKPDGDSPLKKPEIGDSAMSRRMNKIGLGFNKKYLE